MDHGPALTFVLTFMPLPPFWCVDCLWDLTQSPSTWSGFDLRLDFHTIASFVGFAPADDPQFVALVKLDKPTASPWGAVTAAPTFANVARIMIAQLAIPPQAGARP